MAFNGRVTFSGDEAAARKLLPLARQEFDRFYFRMGLASQTFGRHRATLDTEGSWCECRLFPNGMESIHVHAEAAPSNPIPDFYSGAVDPGLFYTLKKGQPGEFGKPVTEDVQVVRSFFASGSECKPFIDAGELQPSGDTFSQRFATVDTYAAGFVDTGRGELLGKQFPVAAHVVPSMYSGLMATCVQYLLGVGRLQWKTKDDDKNEEKMRPLLDRSVKNAARSKIIEKRVSDEKTSEIAYGWTYSRTHGILRADGWPVLVEVTAGGVRACLLPIDPQTDIRRELFTDNTPFKKISHPVLSYLRAKANDKDKPGNAAYYNAVLYVIEKFGGLPTGELPGEMRTAVVDGKETKLPNWVTLLDGSGMKTFAAATPYSTAMGWAFSPTVNEARNTGYVGGFTEMAGLDFTLSFLLSLVDAQDGLKAVSGSASLMFRSASIPPLAQVKFAEPSVNGLVSMPNSIDKNGGSNPYAGKGAVHLHVFYTDGGALKALTYDGGSGSSDSKNDERYGKCTLMEYKKVSISNFKGTSPFVFNGKRITLGAGQTTSVERKPYGEAKVVKVTPVDDWQPSNDIIRNGTLQVTKARVRQQVTNVKVEHSKRESWVIPLYDRCALYRLEFERVQSSSVSTEYEVVTQSVKGKRPWFHRIEQGMIPEYLWPTEYTEEGCTYTRVRPNWFPWKVAGDISSYVPSRPWLALEIAGQTPGCEDCFPNHDIAIGKCNDQDPNNMWETHPPPPQPDNKLVGTPDTWKMQLDFMARDGQLRRVYDRTGPTPAGVGANPEIWYEVYGNWFSRSPDPKYGGYDYMSASTSCAGESINMYYDKDLNSNEYILTTSFGLQTKRGAVPCFVGVLGTSTGVIV